MKPKVSSCTWMEFYTSELAFAEVAQEDRDYIRVRINGGKPKYFYGELAYSDTRRFIADAGDFSVWSVLAG